MSLVTKAFVLEHFGLRLNVQQLAELMEQKEGSVRNQISAKTFPIPTYVEGGRRFASYEAVADYLDEQAAKARQAA